MYCKVFIDSINSVHRPFVVEVQQTVAGRLKCLEAIVCPPWLIVIIIRALKDLTRLWN